MDYEKDFVHIPETQHSIMPVETLTKTPKRHPLLRVFIWTCILGIVILVTASFYAYKSIITPVGTATEEQPILLTIPAGATLHDITEKLAARDLITSPTLFKAILLITKKEVSMQTGEYTFKKPLSMLETIEKLVTGKYEYTPIRLTIREGEDSRVITERLIALFPKLTPTEVAEKMKTLEGTIFPETYLFAPFNTLDEILETIEAEYNKRVGKFKNQIASSTYTEKEILTIASILEKEVPRPSDMKIVSGIIYNRLRTNMPLQMDSTLGYVTGKASLELTTEDLKTDSLYNTYKTKGLPPGPIGNPGEEAIRAALEPETHQYLFFLSDKEGDNHYAKTYAEHLKNRRLYLGK